MVDRHEQARVLLRALVSHKVTLEQAQQTAASMNFVIKPGANFDLRRHAKEDWNNPIVQPTDDDSWAMTLGGLVKLYSRGT